jgi:hypothetical protein
LAIAAPVSAAAQKSGTGAICIAPFHPPRDNGPNMSQTTWPPSSESKFTFRIDGKLKATVAKGEMAVIPGVPADRKVLVEVRLDGKPYESFRLDLREEPEKRSCLWLYEGYWHWVNMGWGDEAKGCRCKSETPGP